ncbi:DUF6502 family protein [Roseateles puraquae]|jgi:hypothetical protein|uniref:DUF6502 family protein n=1 Tax=Roseateles puraquae TaxID=431059 RepID=UPI0031DD7BDE
MHFDFSPLLRYLLRRLVRIAISSGITYQAFCKLLRSVYFEVASEFEPVKGKPNSDSRVSLLTGLPRREVRALRESADAPPQPKPNIERLVLDAWTSSLDFMDAHGDMLPLPRTQRQGGTRSFEALVERVNKDIRARALLDEWLRKGFVTLDEQDRVVLVQRRSTGLVEGASGTGLLLSEMVSDLLHGFDQVYLHEQPVPGFGFNVVYGHRLTEASAQLICSTAQREGVQLMKRINRLVVEREVLDARSEGATRRVMIGFGTYQTDGEQDPGLMAAGSAADGPAGSPTAGHTA